MAYKWKHGKSTLDEDLTLSSSDDEIGNIFCPSSKDEDRLLSDEAMVSAPTPSSTTSKTFSAAKSTRDQNSNQPVAGKEAEASSSQEGTINTAHALKGGEINYDRITGKPLSLSSSKKKSGRNQTSEEIDLDLDEICQQRNILPPPRAPRHQSHHFHYDRPITGARKKFYSIDPRQNLSLDEIIRMVPTGGRNDDHQTIRRRQPTSAEANWRPTSHQQQHALKNEKLKLGLQSITKQHPSQEDDVFENNAGSQERENQVGANQVPEWTPDVWQCVLDLIHKGYSIYWSLMKLKQDENLTEDQKSRLYRCIVSYNQVQGICEAGSPIQAKHGAAANFLGKMKAQFPLLGKVTTKIDEAILLDQSLVRNLIDKLKEKYGHEFGFRFHSQTERVNNHNLFKTKLTVKFSTYEGVSYLSDRASKLMAGKLAFEKELGPCPVQKIHLGTAECTTEESLYRGVESQMVHCFDFSRATIIDPETARATVSNGHKATSSRNSGFNRHTRDIHVSFMDPTSK